MTSPGTSARSARRGLVELTVSYRTPAEVIAVAAQVLAVAAPGHHARPARCASRGSRPASSRRPAPGSPTRWPRPPRQEVAAVAPGRVAVLGPAVMLPELARALSDAGLDPTDPRDPPGDGLAAGLVLLPADETNGLEFDAVVVVEPALVAAVGDELSRRGPAGGHHEGPAHPLRGPHPPTRRLAVVHAEPLPGRPGGPGELTQLAPRPGRATPSPACWRIGGAVD